MDTQNNQDPAKPAQADGQQQPPNNVEIKEGGEAQDYLFFNVMPKEQNQGALVQPAINSETVVEQAPASSGFKEKLKKYKWYFIIAAVLVIGGPLVYFGVSKIGSSQYQSENLLVKHPSLTLPTPTATSTAQTQDFTTPQTWRDKYWPGCTDPSLCGDDADPDHDGLSNLQEYKLGTDPNNPDSDQDGISDGDEVNVFGSNPLNSHTANNPKFSDADYIKGGFSFTTGQKLTPAEIAAIRAKMQTFGLHEPTLTTLGNLVNTIYGFSPPPAESGNASSTSQTLASSTPASGQSASSTSATIDESLSAKQDRDTQRSNTIKNIEIALVGYQADNKTYPITSDFPTMYADVKLYLKVATNPSDPINSSPYVYSYTSNADGSDFSLTFYSEVAAAPITKHAADAQKDASNEQADINDNQREMDMEDLRTALLLYSNANVAGNQTYVFPTKAKYATALVPTYIGAIPKDPVSGQDYDYEPSATFDAFTLKTVLQDPPPGDTGYVCDQVDDCTFY